MAWHPQAARPTLLDDALARLDRSPYVLREAGLWSVESFVPMAAELAGTTAPDAGPATRSALLVLRAFADDDGPDPLRSLLVDAGWERSFVVDETTILHGDHHRPGADTVVRVGLLRRSPAMATREDFAAHWKARHAPLVLANRPHFDRYVANIVVDDGPWDGIVEQRFTDEAALHEHDAAILSSKPLIADDVPRFLGRSEMFIARRAG